MPAAAMRNLAGVVEEEAAANADLWSQAIRRPGS